MRRSHRQRRIRTRRAPLARVLSAPSRIPIVAVLGQSRLRVGQGRRGEPRSCARPACRCSTERRARSTGVGFAGVKGFAEGSAEERSGPGARTSSSVRAGSARRGAEAGDGAGAPAHRAPGGGAALLAGRGTVEGEPQEIYPFLGCSRLEEPLTRYPVDAVFHGHAHHGTPEGRTKGGAGLQRVAQPAAAGRFPTGRARSA